MSKSLKQVAPALLLAGLSQASLAAVSDAEFEALKAAMGELAGRVSALEAENARLREIAGSTVREETLTADSQAAAPAAAPVPDWVRSVRVSGDLRYRYDDIEVGDADARTRHRLRSRTALDVALSPKLDLGVRIAAGSESPTSGNVTFGNGGSSKELYLDRAWARWRPFDGAYLTLGKMANTFATPQGTQLLWDGDYTPEGIAFGWSSDTLFVNGAFHHLESDSRRANRTTYWGLQAGTRLSLTDTVELESAVSYLHMPTSGKGSYYGDVDDFYGNSIRCATSAVSSCVYASDFEVLEWYASLSARVAGLPLALYGDLAQNLDADDHDSAWLAGVRLGKASAAGSWHLGYQYDDVGADAVLGLLRDSDAAGGGADITGHRFYGAYALDARWQVGLTWYFNNEFGKDLTGSATDYDRITLETQFKY
ncbi:putative porin [Haliea atlantica]